MLKINSQRFALNTHDDGGPVRKLAAAARAVMEPMEDRLLSSASPAAAVNQQVNSITAKFETQAMASSGESASGATVWVNQSDTSKSTIIGTDKLGGIAVYDLSGKQIQYISDSSYYKVDTRSGFSLGGKSVSIVAADRIESNTLALFKVDPSTRQLVDVTAGTIKLSIGGNVNGVAMYQSAESGKTFVFVSNNQGGVEQFELSDNGNGEVSAKSVRTFNVGSTSQGMTADDESGALYVSQTNKAIWKYGAEPTDGSVRVQIDNSSTGHVGFDSESLALYKNSDGTGYLIAARQNSNDYVVYDRQTGKYVTKFTITSGAVDGTSGSDGIALTSASLGNGLNGGAFVVEDDKNNGNQNFKVVSWSDIANAQAIPLAIDSGQQAAPVVSTPAPAATPAVTATDTLSVYSLSLYQAKSDKLLATITNGDTIDLADYAGIALNVRAGVTGAVGSVRFGVNGNANARTENYASYDLAGTGGVWSPTAGTYTITATAYSEHRAKGTASASYTVTFTVVDTRVVNTPVPTPVPVPAPTPTPPVVVTPTPPVVVTPPPVVDTPAPTGQPSASNTGPAAGTKFTDVTNLKATSNTTYSNLKITGQVSLTGLSNVTFINCVIDGDGNSYAIRCDGATNITIKNCELFNVTSAGIYGSGFKAISNYIHHSGGDGIKPNSDAVIQGNYITMLGYNSPLAHADGVQIRGGSNFVITGNFFDMPNDVANTKSNSALFVQLDATNITFDGNWINGGNFALHIYSDAVGGNATIKVTNNVYYAGSAQFGFASLGSGVVFSDNVTDAGDVALVSTK